MAIDEALQVRAALSQSTASGDAIVAATVTNGREEIKLVFFAHC